MHWHVSQHMLLNTSYHINHTIVSPCSLEMLFKTLFLFSYFAIGTTLFVNIFLVLTLNLCLRPTIRKNKCCSLNKYIYAPAVCICTILWVDLNYFWICFLEPYSCYLMLPSISHRVPKYFSSDLRTLFYY